MWKRRMVRLVVEVMDTANEGHSEERSSRLDASAAARLESRDFLAPALRGGHLSVAMTGISSIRTLAARLGPRAGRAVTIVLGVLAAFPAMGQIPVVIYGRVQDEFSGEPVAAARIVTADSTNSVFADSLGNFAIELYASATYDLHVEQMGYERTSFQLPGSARSEISLLLLQPAEPVGALDVGPGGRIRIASDGDSGQFFVGEVGPDMVRLRPTVWPEPGDRIRMSSNVTSGEFLVARVRSDGLVLRSDSASAGFQVPNSALRTLAISQGRGFRSRWVVGGALWGGVAGGVFGLQCAQPHRGCPAGFSSGPSVLIGAGLGALIGFVISGKREEKWQDVRLPGQVAVTPIGDGGSKARSTAGSVDLELDQVIEMIVRNQTNSPITVFAWWEGRRRVPLGEIPADATRTFAADYQSPGVVLSVDVLSDRGLSPLRAEPAPSDFILVGSGDRLEWTVRSRRSGLVEDYRRLPPN